jgi:hypothetical protein
MNMKKGQVVKVVTREIVEQVTLVEMLFGGGKQPSFQGEVLAVNPSREEFATLNDNFQAAVEEGLVGPVVDGVVYYDTGAGRAYIYDAEHFEVVTLN